MNTKLLKQKILDLAIRGKLTQQLKSDGTAADLLKEISSACHPERSAKGAKSKDPGTIIPLDKSEAPFEIPENWEWVRLGDLCSKFSTGPFGTMLHKEDYVLEGGVPLVNPTNLQDGVIDSNKIKLVKKEKYESLRPYVLETNDIVLARRGDLSKCAIVSENENLWLAGTGAFFLKLVLVDVNYFIRLYRTSFVQSYLVADSIGSTMDNLNQTTLGNLPILLPPLAEQQRIVAKIEEAFAEIDAIEKNKELLKNHIKQTRQKILDLAIHGKLVPQNKSDEPASVLLERITCDNPHYEKIEDEPFEIPENWIWARINDINFFQSNTENPMLEGNKNRTYELYSVPCFEAKYPEIVKGTEIGSTKVLVNKGDVLISKINPHLNRVWCVPQFTEHRMIASSEWIIIRNPEINQSYLVYVLQSGYFLDKMLSNTSGVGGSLTRAKLYEVKKYEIPLPPLAEQSRIVTKIEELFSALDQMERNLV